MNLDAQSGNRIREERDRLGWSQQQAADNVGIRREMWAKYEAGAEPGANALAGMAKNQVDVTYVLTGKRISQWEQDLFAETARTVKVLEPEGAGPLHDSLASARLQRAQQEAKRLPQYLRLEQALASCTDEDCALVIETAVTLAGRLAKIPMEKAKTA